MAAIRATTSMVVRDIFHPSLSLASLPMFRSMLPSFGINLRLVSRAMMISYSPAVRCAAGEGGRTKASSRLSQIQQILHEAQERALSAGNEPIPKITLVNTKVDMRFNVKDAQWLSERVRDRIMQAEKNRINKDGEIVISSTKTRTQKGNIEDALGKLQTIIDAASYVPPPPSEEQVKKIAKIAAIGEQKRLQNKKVISQKKAFRRGRGSYD